LPAGVVVADWRFMPALTPAKFDARSITIHAKDLPQGGQLLVTAILRRDMLGDSTTGSTQLVIPIDQAPQCSAGSDPACIEVQTVESNFPNAKFLVSAGAPLAGPSSCAPVSG
jgi:hypothetical protein